MVKGIFSFPVKVQKKKSGAPDDNKTFHSFDIILTKILLEV